MPKTSDALGGIPVCRSGSIQCTSGPESQSTIHAQECNSPSRYGSGHIKEEGYLVTDGIRDQ